MRHSLLILLTFSTCFACKEMESMPDVDAAIRDAELDFDHPDNSVLEPEPEDMGADADPDPEPEPTCFPTVTDFPAPSPPVRGNCDCFELEVPPVIETGAGTQIALGCQNPSSDDCIEAGGEVRVDEAVAGGCRIRCFKGEGVIWSVTHDGLRTEWTEGEGDGQRGGLCVGGWSVFLYEGPNERFGAKAADGGPSCVCWSNRGDCPEGCVSVAAPLCEASILACDELNRGEECGVEARELPCEPGDPGCMVGRCLNTDQTGGKACCL